MRVVFLDRDGVINANRDDYVKSWDEFRFLPGALDALVLLRRAGFRIFVVTNQAAVSHGLLSRATLEAIHARLGHAASRAGARIEALRYCPHSSEEQCQCRKPRPGMLLDLAQSYKLALHRAYLVGDAASDIAAGQSVGCRTLLVRTGRGHAQLPMLERSAAPPDAVVADLLAAAHWICGAEEEATQRRRRAAEGEPHPSFALPPLSIGAEEPIYPC